MEKQIQLGTRPLVHNSEGQCHEPGGVSQRIVDGQQQLETFSLSNVMLWQEIDAWQA